MMRAGLIALAALPAPASAQAIACAFTLVCAPEIECERHEGIPFEIAHDGGYAIELEGRRVEATVVAEAPALTLVFAPGDEMLLFSLAPNGEGALTRHGTGPGERPRVATFLGPCVRA
ncbi:hypothetical protein P6F26_10485 [Roseibacterium sp. SDUM158017]|uniref:hypothetical protein n=1 Tax=Roseicyclus salinarum TaxID=3036773 RepID=UPI00241551A0|nr:hypothetical protein [Roseibacterium sp. SDUM158017]MDG4648871.1 hypothetical protein [Roseibacterium sp. SDUM158017]